MSTVVALVLVANTGVVPVSAFELTIHKKIVTQALAKEMDQQALDWIIGKSKDIPGTELPLTGTGNRGSDSIANHLFHAEHHFDSAPDRSAICQRWRDGLDTYLNTAVDKAGPKDGDSAATTLTDRQGALEAFGQATHAVEDFYAHTNWVELATSGLAPPGLAPITGTTCSEDALPNALTSGFFDATSGPLIIAPNPNGSGRNQSFRGVRTPVVTQIRKCPIPEPGLSRRL